MCSPLNSLSIRFAPHRSLRGSRPPPPPLPPMCLWSKSLIRPRGDHPVTPPSSLMGSSDLTGSRVWARYLPYFYGPDHTMVFFHQFWPKPTVKLVGSPVIQAINSSLRRKNILSCNLQGFWTTYQASKPALKDGRRNRL